MGQFFQPGSVSGSIITLVVSIVGAGTLSIPLAVQQSGLLMGIFLIISGALMSSYTLNVLALCSELVGTKSYERICFVLLGHNAAKLAVFCLCLNLYGTTVSYLVASGHTISFVLNHFFRHSLSSQDVTAFVLIFILLPLSFLRSMSALRYSSLIGISCIAFLALVVFLKYFQFCSEHESVSIQDISQNVSCFWESSNNENGIQMFNSQIINAFPIVIFAYTCHPSLLPVLLELKDPSLKRMSLVIQGANFIAVVIYLVIGIFVYMTFTAELAYSHGNFLLNDYKNDTAILLGASGLAISVTFAVPLFVSAFRKIVIPGSVQDLEATNDALEEPLLDNDEVKGEEVIRNTSAAFRFNSVGVLFLIAAGIPAILVKDISIVFSILGATTNPVLCFILPALLINKAAGEGEYIFTKHVTAILAIVCPFFSLVSLFSTAS